MKNCYSSTSYALTIPARTIASVEDVREPGFAKDHLAANECGSSLEESVACAGSFGRIDDDGWGVSRWIKQASSLTKNDEVFSTIYEISEISNVRKYLDVLMNSSKNS